MSLRRLKFEGVKGGNVLFGDGVARVKDCVECVYGEEERAGAHSWFLDKSGVCFLRCLWCLLFNFVVGYVNPDNVSLYY